MKVKEEIVCSNDVREVVTGAEYIFFMLHHQKLQEPDLKITRT